MASTNVDILRDFYETVWNKGEIARLESFFSDSANTEGWFPGMSVSRADFQALIMAIQTMVTDLDFMMLHSVSEGEWVSALVRVDCVSRQTGRPIVVTGQTMVRFEDGQIAEAHNHMDMFGFFVQMDVLPEDLTLRLLTGSDAA